METIDRVAELMVTISEFSALLDVENKAIRAADAATIAALAERKEFLSLHYQRQMRMLADRRAEVAELDLRVRKRLGDTWKSFNDKMSENMQALKALQDATQQVVTLIVDAIRNAQSGGMSAMASAYKGSGAAMGAASGPCVSVTYNRVL